MPEKATLRRARSKLRRGNAPSTAAGEFIREEIEHIRDGKHGARSTKQAIAIGLSKARRAGVPLEDPRAGNPQTKKQARRDRAASRHPHKPDARRSRAIKKALAREPHRTASKKALSRHAKRTAKQALATRRRHERTGAKRTGKQALATRRRHERTGGKRTAKRALATGRRHARVGAKRKTRTRRSSGTTRTTRTTRRTRTTRKTGTARSRGHRARS